MVHHKFLQWLMSFCNGSWVFALVRGFAQWFVGLRNGLWVRNGIGVFGSAQTWFVGLRNGFVGYSNGEFTHRFVGLRMGGGLSKDLF